MSNIILWSWQITVDFTYQTGSRLPTLCDQIVKANLGVLHLVPRFREALVAIKEHGLQQDTAITTSSSDPKLPDALAKLRRFIHERGHKESIQIGGNPGISAVRGHLLRQGPEYTELPLSYYAGLYPSSVQEVVEKSFSEYRDALRVKQSVAAWPQTIGLETPDAKLMLIHGPGRSLADLAPDGDFTEFLNLSESVLAGSPKGRAIFAFNIPSLRPVKVRGEELTELDFAKRLVNGIKTHFKKSELGKRIRIFMSTRAIDNLRFATETLSLLQEAQIISMNEVEANMLHTAYNDGKHSDAPLAYKVRELPLTAILVCHSAYGAIMDLGCHPESIITSKKFCDDPPAFLEEVLRLSADGATYAMDATAGLGRQANEAMIRIYSENVSSDNRQREKFKATFQALTEPMPAGMLWIPSARAVQTLGAVVGLGAIFDGLLLSFLMRD